MIPATLPIVFVKESRRFCSARSGPDAAASINNANNEIRRPALLMLAAASGPLRAEQIFDFSFTNTIGNVAGIVAGEIVLPFDGDGSGAASQVLIESFPPGLSSVGTPPIDASQWTYQEVNQFMVSSGEVTGASEFYAYTSTSYPSSVIELTPTTSYLAYGAGPLSQRFE